MMRLVVVLLAVVVSRQAAAFNIMRGRAPIEEQSYSVHVQSPDLPVSFDARTAWPGCVHPILDQGHCGSCWAFAATESLSDRFCIASEGQINVTLSPGDLVRISCSSGLTNHPL